MYVLTTFVLGAMLHAILPYARNDIQRAWKKLRAKCEARRTQWPLETLHRFAASAPRPSWVLELCSSCGRPDDHPCHCHPDGEPRTLTMARLSDAYLIPGSLGTFARAVFSVDPDAKVWTEQKRFPATVFIETSLTRDGNDNGGQKFEHLRKAVWFAKTVGVLVIVIGVGALSVSLEEQETWLREAGAL